MKILFITTKNINVQGDYFELTILNGLKEILGKNCYDFPRKDIIYHDFSKVKKENLHGQGFTLLNKPIIDDIQRKKDFKKNEFDFVLYGCGHAYGEEVFVDEFDKLSRYGSWVLDGHDLYGEANKKIIYKGEEVISTQFENSFKRELIVKEDNVYPSGFGIPEHMIRPINLKNKKQLFQKSYPKFAFFETPTDLGGSKKHHIFSNEELYYDDLHKSWFGLSCKKGGWDSLRNYEIIAAGTLLLYRDYNDKPKLCSPHDLPCINYSTKKQLKKIVNKLIINNTPTKEYLRILNSQREWLYRYGTTKSRAANILKVLSSKMDK